MASILKSPSAILDSWAIKRAGSALKRQRVDTGAGYFPVIYGATRAGVTVNEQAAMQLSAVYACRKILAETLASTPLILYRDRARADRAAGANRATTHPLYDVLKIQANSYMPAMAFKEAMMMDQTGCFGNSYAWIERDRLGRTVGLVPIPASKISMMQDADSGAIYYRSLSDGQEYAFRDILHIPALTMNGIRGMGPLEAAMEAAGLGLAAQNYGADYFARGGRLMGVLTHPNHLSEDALAELKKSWREQYEGVSPEGRTAILEEGMKYEDIGVTPEEAQFLETRKFQVQEIGRIFRIPPHMLGDLDRATFSNIEHLSLEFLQYTMLPWYTRWEQHLNMMLLNPDERANGYFCEFLIDNMLRADAKSRAERLHLMRQDAVINADEWRELENMSPQTGSAGRVYFGNGNMVDVELAKLNGASGRIETTDTTKGGEAHES